MLRLETRDDVARLIAESERESLTLEFKAGPAIHKDKKGEIGKDVSAMANAAGGQIIYGIKEKGHVAADILPVNSSQFNHEWLEKVIRNNISPPIEGLSIKMIDVGPEPNDVVYVVTVPKATVLAPHQAKFDLKYYRRHNFSADPMADYEIREAMRRQIEPKLEVNLKMTRDQGGMIPLVRESNSALVPISLFGRVINESSMPALYYQISIMIDIRLRVHSNLRSFGFIPTGRHRHQSGAELSRYSKAYCAPSDFPLFKELPVELPRIEFGFDRHAQIGEIFLIGWSAVCPGYSGTGFYTLEFMETSARFTTA